LIFLSFAISHILYALGGGWSLFSSLA
jgi:hypothetical protein